MTWLDWMHRRPALPLPALQKADPALLGTHKVPGETHVRGKETPES